MFVRAPENELNHGADLTLGFPEIEDRFSEAYTRAFKVPLLDHSFYRNLLQRNFRPISYAQLTAEYPCIVVRIHLELDARTSVGLLELKPDHCLVKDIHVYTLGIANPGRCAARLRPSFAQGAAVGGDRVPSPFPPSYQAPNAKRPPRGGLFA